MEISPILLAKMLFVCFAFGIQMGILFDIGRALRGLFSNEVKSKRVRGFYQKDLLFTKREFPKMEKRICKFFKNTHIFLFDIIFVVFAVWGLIKINYSYNDGGMRAFTIVGLVAGFFCYYFTLSRLVVFLLESLVFALKYLVFSVFVAIFSPFSKIYNKLVKKFKKSLGKFRFRLEKKSKKVYNVCEILCKNSDSQGTNAKVKIKVCKKSGKESGQNEEK